jgi:hypothetical protein
MFDFISRKKGGELLMVPSVFIDQALNGGGQLLLILQKFTKLGILSPKALFQVSSKDCEAFSNKYL